MLLLLFFLQKMYKHVRNDYSDERRIFYFTEEDF